jgi:hypothetical protein
MADNFDNAFIKRATRVTSFNVTAADFQSLKHKREIQFLYKQYMFGSFDPDEALEKKLDKRLYNLLIKKLKADDKSQYANLHNLSLKGIGPSEAVFYLLTKDGRLGGGASAGLDLVMPQADYELKAVKWKSASSKDYVADFKLGGNIPGMTNLESDIQQKCYELGITTVKGAPEISGAKFEELKQKDPDAFEEFRDRYQTLAYKHYFSKHEVVFVQNQPTQADFGEIIAIKNVKKNEIEMERYTSRSIKPLVKV